MTESEQKKIFDTWLDQHQGIFFKIIRAYAFTLHDQEDLFQEIAIQVWKSIPDFRGESKPSTWIYRISLYVAAAWVKREKREVETQPLADIEHTLSIKSQPRNERLDWLYEQIALLDPIDRSICLLMLDGFSYKEIAELVGISNSLVGVKIHRIKRHLTRRSQEVLTHGV